VIASFDCARLRLSVLQGLRLLLGSFLPLLGLLYFLFSVYA